MSAERGYEAVRVVVRSEQEDELSGALWELSPAGLEIQGEQVPGQLPVVAYFPARAGLLNEVRVRLQDLSPLAVETSSLPDVDWVENFKRSFTAFRAGGFQVLPEWEPRPEDLSRTLVVDPGRAFGTGTHETTRLCLARLELAAACGRLGRVLDVGTGTGLLALAALKLGASSVVALDNDPEAMRSARSHARLNGLSLALVLGEGVAALRPAAFDLLLANLMAPLLLELRTALVARVAPRGSLVLSGLLTDDVPEVGSAYAEHGSIQVDREGEWAALTVCLP